jgi:hypothetical protein
VPQFVLSLSVSAQNGVPPSGEQIVCVDVQSEEHAPALHVCKTPEHVIPHVPQLALSLCKFAQYEMPASPHAV